MLFCASETLILSEILAGPRADSPLLLLWCWHRRNGESYVAEDGKPHRGFSLHGGYPDRGCVGVSAALGCIVDFWFGVCLWKFA